MGWLKAHWRWTALNSTAAAVMVIVITQGRTDWNWGDGFDSILESGKWALRLLLICLAMTPLNTYFGWKSGIGLRKSAGLWAFAFAALHVGLNIRETELGWFVPEMPVFISLGLVGLAVLAALAITSNRWAMKRLGKFWKRLHRLVYAAGCLVATQALLATQSSKRIFRDPQAVEELTVYAIVLAALLIVRFPLVRTLIQHGLVNRRPAREVNVPAIVVEAQESVADFTPVNDREIEYLLDGSYADVQPHTAVEDRETALR